jgi:phosphoglucosamine mutase
MANKPQLFGTDGVRGVAGQPPLDPATIWKLGFAIGAVLGREPARRAGSVLVGEDTRESSLWISRALAAGLRQSGVMVSYAGVITTPGVAFLARHHGFAAGIMVSASHNPFEDNGIKVLSSSGMKLGEQAEMEIERALASAGAAPATTDQSSLEVSPAYLTDYLDYLASLAGDTARLAGMSVVADCAQGASSRVAPQLFRRLGITARVLNAQPDGRNINLGCGSLHPETMGRETKSANADLGVAFDGDADRALFSTRDGRVVDGDSVLYACAKHFQAQGKLRGDHVVGTLMTNLGLEVALKPHGIGLKRTAVGDKYVLEEMTRSGINLGGEPSGHIIFSDISLAGDGLITMLQMLRLLAETGRPLDALIDGLRQFPQIIRNVRVREKPPLDSLPPVEESIARSRREFGERGRVVVRYSGTEKLARVMVEAEDAQSVERHARLIAEAIEAAIGAR